jgi:hypothetical protein
MKMKLSVLWGIFGLFGISSLSYAMPAQVILIRHAEKEDNGNELNAKGFQRANALPKFFETNSVINSVGPVDVIYAMAPHSDDGSVRAIETMTPTAEALGIKLDKNYTRDEVSAVTNEILHSPALDGKNIVMCWEHQVIPQLASALGANAPDDWEGSVFDRAWVLKFDAGGKVSFQDIGENVLPGDTQ